MTSPLARMCHDEIFQIVDDYSTGRLEDVPPRKSLVVILRGLPGAGKSTFATLLKMYAEGLGLEAQICSADDYFQTLQGYRFNPSDLGVAHDQCRAYCIHALQRGVPVVIIDNTNVELREWNPYVGIARGGCHAICRVNIRGALTAEELAARSRRDIGVGVISQRLQLLSANDSLYAPHYEVAIRTEVFAAREDELPERTHPMDLMFFDEVEERLRAFLEYRRVAPPIEQQHSLVIILRGLPGCGKTTFALQTKLYADALGLTTLICSSDDSFRSRHGFHFDPARVGEASGECAITLRFALHRHVDVVVVDDANITEEEWRLTAFEASLHQVVFVTFVCPSIALAREQLARTFTHCRQVDAENLDDHFAAFQRAEFPAHFNIVPVFNAREPFVAETNRATQP